MTDRRSARTKTTYLDQNQPLFSHSPSNPRFIPIPLSVTNCCVHIVDAQGVLVGPRVRVLALLQAWVYSEGRREPGAACITEHCLGYLNSNAKLWTGRACVEDIINVDEAVTVSVDSVESFGNHRLFKGRRSGGYKCIVAGVFLWIRGGRERGDLRVVRLPSVGTRHLMWVEHGIPMEKEEITDKPREFCISWG